MHVSVSSSPGIMIQRVPSSQAKLVINSNPLGQIKFKSKFVVWAWPDGLGHETIWDRSYKPWKQPWFFRVYRGWNTSHLYGDYFINQWFSGLLHQRMNLCFHVVSCAYFPLLIRCRCWTGKLRHADQRFEGEQKSLLAMRLFASALSQQNTSK